MKRFIIGFCLVCAPALGGCTAGVQIDTPSGFAELDDQESYGYRATNAEGVVLAVRREANEPAGDLGFWTGAVDAHLRRQGYQAVDAVDVKTGSGISGKQIRYSILRSDREHAFWVTVFVTAEEVVTVEVGGDKAFFDQLEKSLSQAIQSLELS